MMKREKSCGVLVLRQQEDELYVVLLRHRFGGHWSFPKGHVEAGESERQTALREVREETGLTGIKLMDGFRESVEYSPKPGVKKQVVYFLGTTEQEKLIRQEEEISEIMSKVSLKQLAAPCILYNLNGYYDHLKALLAHMIDMGLSTPERQEGIYFAETLDDIRAILKI